MTSVCVFFSVLISDWSDVADWQIAEATQMVRKTDGCWERRDGYSTTVCYRLCTFLLYSYCCCWFVFLCIVSLIELVIWVKFLDFLSFRFINCVCVCGWGWEGRWWCLEFIIQHWSSTNFHLSLMMSKGMYYSSSRQLTAHSPPSSSCHTTSWDLRSYQL